MIDAVRLGQVACVAHYLKRGVGRAHKSGLLYICEAVLSPHCDPSMLRLLLDNESCFFEPDVSGKCAVEYALGTANFEVLAFMAQEHPGFANMEIDFRGRYVSVSRAAVRFRNPDLLTFLHALGGKLGCRDVQTLIRRMWRAIRRSNDDMALRVLKDSCQCIAACVLMGASYTEDFSGFDEFEEVDWFCTDALSTFQNGFCSVNRALYPKTFAYHKDMCALLPRLHQSFRVLSQLEHPDVWRRAIDERAFAAWTAHQKQIARACYAALYHGDGETPRGRAPLRALGDADTVRHLLTLFLVFPKRLNGR